MLRPALRNLLQRSAAITEITVPTRAHSVKGNLRAIVRPSAKTNYAEDTIWKQVLASTKTQSAKMSRIHDRPVV